MDEPRFSVDQDWLVRIRRELHAHPEIGWELENTVRVVRRELDAIGIPYEVDRYGRNTIVATVNPEIPSFTLGLRADMDALPIQEKNTWKRCPARFWPRARTRFRTCGA